MFDGDFCQYMDRILVYLIDIVFQNKQQYKHNSVKPTELYCMLVFVYVRLHLGEDFEGSQRLCKYHVSFRCDKARLRYHGKIELYLFHGNLHPPFPNSIGANPPENIKFETARVV